MDCVNKDVDVEPYAHMSCGLDLIVLLWPLARVISVILRVSR